MLDLHRLRILRELHRRGTITAVAQALSYSPSAVSQQLATLERETGVKLLEPAGRRVRLTAQADVLVAHAEVLLAEMERAESALARSLQETAGTLRVAAFQTAVLTLVPSAIRRLQSAHPDLRIEVTELEPDTALPALVVGDFDVVLDEEYPGHPLPLLAGVSRSDLFTDELLLAVPSPWAGRDLLDVAKRPFALEPASTPAGQWALATCREAGFEPDVRYTSTDLQIHLRLVEQQLAVALIPQLADAQNRPGIALNPMRDHPNRTVFIAVRNGALDHPAVRAFTTALAQTHQQLDSPPPAAASEPDHRHR
ncbi:transcriptional regulator [Actinoplanes italicus]|uniref:DNA-binding transcriptional LysR family regulator n=1 Tax=Actinoplanes italicus TaxID=113567 RepID=A0A2T0KHU0_9ACTN|nr:DNA-binding transcriptional LysR family regulator [Actinoplanes italicus]GIE28522.1 transcriptional regulator [Actinoplanes italicus]